MFSLNGLVVCRSLRAAVLMLCCASADAAVQLGATRLIFLESNHEAALAIKNEQLGTTYFWQGARGTDEGQSGDCGQALQPRSEEGEGAAWSISSPPPPLQREDHKDIHALAVARRVPEWHKLFSWLSSHDGQGSAGQPVWCEPVAADVE